MKNPITFCFGLFFTVAFGQTDLENPVNLLSHSRDLRTPELEALYQQAKILETTGTAQQIEANRLAVKAEWQTINPAIAKLYKPIDVGGKLPEIMENVHVNGMHYPEILLPPRKALPTDQTRQWITDRLVHDGFIDGGVDMEVSSTGDIFISGFQNDIIFGGTFDFIYIYRSTDGGASFQLYDTAEISASIQKMELISMDGTGDDYLLAYFLTDSETFQVLRWNITTGDPYDADIVSTDVSDFAVDRNFPANTSGQRVFATYLKPDGGSPVLTSARSTAGSYGFDWVDETVCGNIREQIDFAYGLNGGCYSTDVGGNSGNLYVTINNNYNDPASWSPSEIIEDGSLVESLNPVIVATREALPTEEVLVCVSRRDAGSTDDYGVFFYRRENGSAFNSVYGFLPTGGFSWMHPNAWVEKANGTEEIRIANVYDKLDDSEMDENLGILYDGNNFSGTGQVSDPGFDVFDGFASVIEETADNFPCMAFSGTEGIFGRNIYFDGESPLILSTQGNTIEVFSHWPNPAGETLNLSASSTIEKVWFHNILGQKVLEATPGQTTAILNTSGLASGLYVMKVTANGQTGTYKILKQ